jgi:hypothetical protein
MERLAILSDSSPEMPLLTADLGVLKYSNTPLGWTEDAHVPTDSDLHKAPTREGSED